LTEDIPVVYGTQDSGTSSTQQENITAQTTRTIVRFVFAGQLAVHQRLNGLTFDSMLHLELS
jgi:hypothetical protein